MGGCYDYYSLEAFETARQQTACIQWGHNLLTLRTQLYQGICILAVVAVVNTFHFMDVLIIGEPMLKEKIVDGKGNIQNGKKGPPQY